MTTFDKNIISVKREALEKISSQLKTEFFGLDEIIDKVIKSIHAWYIFPEIITRPVIVNLWGMTGVGKTQLVRRLVSLLEFQDRFVEVQMDGGSMKSSYDASSLSKLLSSSSIDENQPGILLLDEIQRFRTVGEDGGDVKLERFQDVWTLLSDGKFSADASMFQEIEMMIASQEYQKDWVSVQEPDDDDDDLVEAESSSKKKQQQKARKFKIYPYEAKSLKKTLRLTESVQEIMKWDPTRVEEELNKLKASRTTWEIDYSKLVIFISGNLDNAFLGSRSTDDCDTDADFYHEETKKITSMNIKAILRQRFRPEQISRMGNNHIIYPSMSRRTYEKLIKTTVQKYLDEMQSVSSIKFDVGDDILTEIYNNSVFPTQGTRPVFSSIHMIFSSLLSEVTFWAIENEFTRVSMTMDDGRKAIMALGFKDTKRSVDGKTFPVELEMNEKKAKSSIDFKTLIAVHEAGHAIVYSLLTNTAPKEVKINVASFTGGYMLPSDANQAVTRRQIKDKIAIGLAGLVAEEMVFGLDERSNGAAQDIFFATNLANSYVRQLGFDGYTSYINGEAGNVTWMTAIKETDPKIESLMCDEKSRAQSILMDHQDLLKVVVDALIATSGLDQEAYIELFREHTGIELSTHTKDLDFHKRWERFKK